MKAKIVALAVSFALGFTAIFFSVRPHAEYSGKGSGKSTAVNTPSELAKITENLPSGYDYYQMAQKSKTGKTAKDSSEGKPRSLTLRGTHSINESVTDSYRLGDVTGSKSHDISKNQKCTAYFTADGVYYDMEYTVSEYTTLTQETHVSEKINKIVMQTYTFCEYEYDMYVGVDGVFLKYYKYNLIEEEKVLINDEEQTDKNDEEESYDEEIKNATIEAIQKNYGKWINVSENFDKDFENFNPETSGNSMDEFVSYCCFEVGQMIADKMLNVIDEDINTLSKLGELISAAEEKSNETFTKKNRTYKLTDTGKLFLLPLLSCRISKDKFRSDGSFVVDMTNRMAPAWYLDLDYNFYDGNYEGYDEDFGYNVSSHTEDKSYHEKVLYENIDNTVTPKVGKSKPLSKIMGKLVRKILEENYGSGR